MELEGDQSSTLAKMLIDKAVNARRVNLVTDQQGSAS